MLRPSDITLADLGDELAAMIPGKDPELAHPEWEFTINRIPVSELDDVREIIPVCEPTLNGNETKYVMECLESNWISSAGKYIAEFEE